MEMSEANFSGFSRHTLFGINLPGIHPLEVVATVADANPGAENCYLVRRAMNDRNPELSGRALLY